MKVYIKVKLIEGLGEFLTSIITREENSVIETYYYRLSPKRGVLKKYLSPRIFKELISICAKTEYEICGEFDLVISVHYIIKKIDR